MLIRRFVELSRRMRDYFAGRALDPLHSLSDTPVFEVAGIERSGERINGIFHGGGIEKHIAARPDGLDRGLGFDPTRSRYGAHDQSVGNEQASEAELLAQQSYHRR
jgi:hypothetical protein